MLAEREEPLGTFRRTDSRNTRTLASSLARRLSTEEWVNIGILSLFAVNGTITFVPASYAPVATHVVLLTFWLCSILAFLSNHSRIHLELWTCRFAAIYLAWTLLSLTWGTAPLSVSYSPAISSICVFLYFNYVLDRFTILEFTRLLTWTLTLLLILSVLFVFLVPGHGRETVVNVGSWKGVFRQKNELGLDCALAAAVCVGLRPVTELDRIWRWGLLILALVLDYGSQSRESWISIILMVLLSFSLKLVRNLQPKSRFPVVLGTSITLVVTGFLAYTNLDAVLALFGRDRTFTGRSGIWEGVRLLILRRPWLGYGTYGIWNTDQAYDVIVRVGFQATSAHNSYLDTILTYGLIGLVLFIPIPVSSFLFTFRAIMSYSLDHFEIFIYLVVVLLVMSFAMSVMTYSPGISLVLLLFAVSNLEKVERSGLMSLELKNA